ncbi:MAG: sulfite exporter TauE/SafE family protein [Saprospiraceae bacterium]|jgi:uncharacterized membrane protein YfcA
MTELLSLTLLFFLIALVYSSAGFGGGSSYLATLSLFGLEFLNLRMIALICNIVVVSSSVFLFSKYKFIIWKKIFPLMLFSVPLAFVGASLKLDVRFFYLVLGFSLLLSALFMMIDTSKELRKLPRYSNALIGSGIGFLSGMAGIGGGIFLSPLLHLSKWDKPKIIAATSAAFILANSLSGLLGQVYAHGFNIEWKTISVLVLAVILGSQIGIRMTIFKLNPMHVKRLTAFVILLVSLRLLFKYI